MVLRGPFTVVQKEMLAAGRIEFFIPKQILVDKTKM